MIETIGIVAPGAMGAAIARRLGEKGAKVLTLLEGRSAGTRERAQAAGMVGVDLATLLGAQVILSVVPPGEARALAEQFASAMASSPTKPIYVDCNAVDATTVQQIGAMIETAGAPFVDAAIIGLPPKPGEKGPTFYFSGPSAPALTSLADLGLETRIIDGPIGAASALKMSYAGITKGIAAVASAMILAASRAGASDALYAELAASQPQLLQRFKVTLPDMFPKAYRWVAEMREIAVFAGEDAAAAGIYDSAALLYEYIARDYGGKRQETGAIERFLLQSGHPSI